jgi:hypothetical protein
MKDTKRNQCDGNEKRAHKRIASPCPNKQTKRSQEQYLINTWVLSQGCSIVQLHRAARLSTPGLLTTLKQPAEKRSDSQKAWGVQQVTVTKCWSSL